jgi:predicted RNase H-like nuclease
MRWVGGRGALRLAAVGVDGCRAGWVAVRGYEDARGALVRTEPHLLDARAGGLRALVLECEATRPAPSVAVDVPMGLPHRAGLRACDRAARERLGARRSCVFPAPDRELLCCTFAGARAIVRGRGAGHPVLSHQAVGLFPKIAEADALLLERPQRQAWLVEAHPELSFLALAGAPGPLPPKRRGAGRAARRALLAAAMPDSERRLAAWAAPRRAAALDDVLDAYAALWSARRHAAGGADVLGDGGRDEHGLLMQIVT